jgi:hypothetical protein
MNEQPTGEVLYNEVCEAAAKAGKSLAAFVSPIFNGASWKIEQMRIAKKPTVSTIKRVRALVAGEPLPPRRFHRDPRAAGLSRLEAEQRGFERSKRSVYEQHLLDGQLAAKARLERHRFLSEAARETRRPGQTLQERLLELQQSEANGRG